MRLIGEDAEPYLDPGSVHGDWPSRAIALDEQSRAVEVLEREYGSVRHLAAGAAATVLLCLAVAVAGLAGVIVVAGGLAAGEVALILAVGVALTGGLAVPGWRLGRAAVRSGRRVANALVRWHRLPETVAVDGSYVPPEHRRSPDAISDADRRRIAKRDAVLARTYVYRWPIFVRAMVSGVLGVALLMAWGIPIVGVVRGAEGPEYVAAATMGGIATVLTGTLTYMMGGAHRVNAAHARRDPIYRRIRQVFRR